MTMNRKDNIQVLVTGEIRMKKLLIVTVMGLLMLSLTGCFFGLINFPVNEQQATDKMANQIIKALDEKDVEALRGVFSGQALSEADDLNEGMAYIFDLYEGSSTEIKNPGNGYFDHYGNPGRTKKVSGHYRIITDKASYDLFIYAWLINEQDLNSVGVYRIALIDCDEYQNRTDNDYGVKENRKGIYHRGWDNQP
jgi:hypothetical protein